MIVFFGFFKIFFLFALVWYLRNITYLKKTGTESCHLLLHSLNKCLGTRNFLSLVGGRAALLFASHVNLSRKRSGGEPGTWDQKV